MMFHRHRWEEVGRTFAQSRAKNFNAEQIDPDLVKTMWDEATFGVTSIELRCSGCGLVTERRLIGDHTKAESGSIKGESG